MTVTSGFFTSQNHDRLYTADQINTFFEGLVGEGVYKNVGGGLQVVAGEGMQVKVKSGKLSDSHGRWLKNESTIICATNEAHSSFGRYDAVIAQIDASISKRSAQIFVRTGEASSNPQKPQIRRTNDIEEYVLAYIYIRPKMTSISTSDIIDTRLDSKVCGYVTGLIEQLDTSDLFNQWTDIFNKWLSNVQSAFKSAYVLSAYRSSYIVSSDCTDSIPININEFNKDADILNVYENGLRIIPDDEYIIVGNNISLMFPADKGTDFEFEVIKCTEDPNGSAAKAINQLRIEIEEIKQTISLLHGLGN